MRAILFSIALTTLAPAAVNAERLFDHPAVAVQRLHAQQGYDYASKFYPHPAWLHLSAAAPQRDGQAPAQQAEATPYHPLTVAPRQQ